MIIPGVVASGRQINTGTALAQEILADAPRWYCQHNETSGTVAINQGTTGANGTYVGTPVFQSPALYTGGLPCWNTNNASSVNIPASALPTTGSTFTLLIVCKLQSVTGTQQLINRDSDSITPRLFQWRLNGTTLEFVKIVGGVQTASVTSIAVLNDSVFLVVTVTAAGSVKSYKNGSLVGTTSLAAASYGNNSVVLNIGIRDSSNRLNARISDTAIFDFELSAARITAYMSKISFV